MTHPSPRLGIAALIVGACIFGGGQYARGQIWMTQEDVRRAQQPATPAVLRAHIKTLDVALEKSQDRVRELERRLDAIEGVDTGYTPWAPNTNDERVEAIVRALDKLANGWYVDMREAGRFVKNGDLDGFRKRFAVMQKWDKEVRAELLRYGFDSDRVNDFRVKPTEGQ